MNRFRAFLFLALVAFCNQTQAATWTATTGGDWSTASNWSGSFIPTSGDDAFISNNFGTVQLSGTAAAHDLFLGYFGTGYGHITHTGTSSVLNTNNATLGYTGTSLGQFVSDSAFWNNAGTVTVGASGTGILNLHGLGTGGLKTTNLTVGDNSTASGQAYFFNPVNVSVSNNLIVGNSGTGLMQVSVGAHLVSNNTIIGNNSTGTGSVSIVGVGWTNTSTIVVGKDGRGTLGITQGGVVTTAQTSVGAYGSVTVDGASSRLNSDIFLAGVDGSTGTSSILVQNGGAISTGDTNLAFGNYAAATVTGAGSIWTATTKFTIGQYHDATLTVSNGGVAESVYFTKGDNAGTISLDGGTLRALQNATFLTGGNSTWVTVGAGGGTIDNNGHSISIDTRLGGTGTLTLQGSGTTIFNTDQSYSGDIVLKNGLLTVDGNRGDLENNSSRLIIGETNGDNATAEFIFEANVQNGSVVLGKNQGSLGTINVRNESSWTVSNNIIVGDNGAGVLDISERSTVQSYSYSYYGPAITLGNGLTGSGSLRIDNSSLTAPVTIGGFGVGTLTVANSGTLIGGGLVGSGSASIGRVYVDGPGSVWSGSVSGGITVSSIGVGGNGSGYVYVRDGGTLRDLNYLGSGTTGYGLVKASNGSTITSQYLTVGGLGTGDLILEQSSTFTGGSVTVGGGPRSLGTISIGGGSVFSSTSYFVVGSSGTSTGSVQVGDNSTLNTEYAYIGGAPASSGTVTISGAEDGAGPASTWNVSEAFAISTGGTATLTVDRGAVVNVGSGAGTIYMATGTTGSATLNIGAALGDTVVASGNINAGEITGLHGGIVNFNHTGSTNFVPILSGSLSVQNNAGLTVLSGSNSYAGGTLINSGTLSAANNNAVGTGQVKVGTGATFVVEQGVNISRPITLSGGTYQHKLGAGAQLGGAIIATSDLGGYGATTAAILAGTTSAATTLSASFSVSDGTVLSDILHLSGVPIVSGSRTDLFALEFSMANITAGTYLAWLDGQDEWVNATLGNFGNNASGAQQNYAGNFLAFQTQYGTNLSSYIGAWGFSNNTVWAVLNHNSDFGVVPEPSTVLLVGVGLTSLLFRRRR